MTNIKREPEGDQPGDSLEAANHTSLPSSYALNDVYVSTMPTRLVPPPSVPGQFHTLFDCYVAPAPTQLPAFLQQINIRDLLDRKVYPHEWRYADRHHAQNILPYLCLGPWSVVKDPVFLQKNGITMIVAVTRGDTTKEQPGEFKEGDRDDVNSYKSLPRHIIEARTLRGLSVKILTAAGNANLTSKRFSETAEFINDHMATMNPAPDYPFHANNINGCVLVCSEGGNMRAAALVIAYLMKTFAASLPFAHRLTLDSRSSIHFDAVLTNLLWSFHETLQAEVAVSNYHFAQTAAQTVMPLHNDPKRKHSDCEGEVDDEGGHDPGKKSGDGSTSSRRFVPFYG